MNGCHNPVVMPPALVNAYENPDAAYGQKSFANDAARGVPVRDVPAADESDG